MKQNFVSLKQSLISKELEDGGESKRQWNIITTKAVTTLIMQYIRKRITKPEN